VEPSGALTHLLLERREMSQKAVTRLSLCFWNKNSRKAICRQLPHTESTSSFDSAHFCIVARRSSVRDRLERRVGRFSTGSNFKPAREHPEALSGWKRRGHFRGEGTDKEIFVVEKDCYTAQHETVQTEERSNPCLK
jgi:hypothetical protein